MQSTFTMGYVSTEDISVLFANNNNEKPLTIEVQPVPQTALFAVQIEGTWQAIIKLVNHLSIDQLKGRAMPYKDKAKRVEAVNKYKRSLKIKLVDAHGGRCFDCGIAFPPFLFEFDHRDPTQKSFQISRLTKFNLMLEESMKCDMVCPNCHRFRTHKRTCGTCEWCLTADSSNGRAIE